MEKFGWQFRPRDKVIQTENDYDKDVFNGDIGQIVKIDPVEREVTIRYDQREIVYDFGELDEVTLACAITIHKSQGRNSRRSSRRWRWQCGITGPRTGSQGCWPDRITAGRQLRQKFIPDPVAARRSRCSCSPFGPSGSVS